MRLSRELMWTAISSAVAIGASLFARKAVTVGWERLAGHEPPVEDDDADVSWTEAIAWAAAIGAAVGVARVVSRRSAAVVWEKATGEPATDRSKP
jgi:hypothetical protein